MWVLIIILIYLLTVHFISRLFIPYLGFTKHSLPQKIPNWLEADIAKLNKSAKSDREFLKSAYDYVTSKHHCSRLETITKFHYLFQSPFLHRSGYLPCTISNHLLHIILVRSGRFTESDIKLEVVPFNFIVHQYLRVRVEDHWIYVDPGGQHLGAKFGERAAWFG